MSSISVCHLTSVHKDGDVRIFHKECVSLVEAGYRVSLIIPNTYTRIEKDVNIISFEAPKGNRLTRMTKTVNIVYKMAINVDAEIYHFHDPELLRIAKKLKRKGKKVVYDVHEDLPRQIISKPYLNKNIRGFISKRVEKYENKIAAKMDYLCTATPFIRERFLSINKNTIDVNNFPILKELLIDFPYEEKTADNICYVGGIEPTRGIKELVQSLESTNVKLLLAGSFSSSAFRAEVSQIPSWNQVNEMGFLTRKGVRDVYKQSKIGIVTLHPLPNYLDALAVKMFEYMAGGIPVIASNFPLWKTIIEDNNAGICVDPLNPKEISDAINYLISNPEKAKEMGENGKKMVIEKYNWDNEKKKLIDLYKSLEP